VTPPPGGGARPHRPRPNPTAPPDPLPGPRRRPPSRVPIRRGPFAFPEPIVRLVEVHLGDGWELVCPGACVGGGGRIRPPPLPHPSPPHGPVLTSTPPQNYPGVAAGVRAPVTPSSAPRQVREGHGVVLESKAVPWSDTKAFRLTTGPSAPSPPPTAGAESV